MHTDSIDLTLDFNLKGLNLDFSSTENVKMAINGMAYLMCVQHSAWSQGYCGENRIKSIYMEYPSQEFRYNHHADGAIHPALARHQRGRNGRHRTPPGRIDRQHASVHGG